MADVELTATDLRAMLDILGRAHQTTGAAEFGDVLLRDLAALVRCDLISYNEIDLIGGATQTFFEPHLVPRPELQEAFAHHIDQHPLVRDYAATRDPLPRLMSDFIDLTHLRKLDLYHHVFQPLETNYQLAFSVAIDTESVIGIGLNRTRNDFTHRDVAVMTALQPHLAAAYEHAVLRGKQTQDRQRDEHVAQCLGALTSREREVAALVVAGSGNREIARALFISERTAEKHVANIMRKLEVRSRAAITAQLIPRGA